MRDHPGFLKAIAADRDDDVPRLVYADWLEEDGQPDRAAYIRSDCEIAKLLDYLTYQKKGKTVRRKGREAPPGHDFISCPCEKCRPWKRLLEAKVVTAEKWLVVREGVPDWVEISWWRRGFPQAVYLTAREFLKEGHAEVALCHGVVEEVEFSTLPLPQEIGPLYFASKVAEPFGMPWTDFCVRVFSYHWPTVKFLFRPEASVPMFSLRPSRA